MTWKGIKIRLELHLTLLCIYIHKYKQKIIIDFYYDIMANIKLQFNLSHFIMTIFMY